MRTGVRVTGFRELDRALGELPKATAKNVLKRVGKAALEPMAAAAEQLAPKRLGKLALSVDVSDKRTRRAKRPIPPGTVVIVMGPGSGTGTLQYATHVEFGTVDTAPRPFMRPAWDGGQQRLLKDVIDGLTVEIGRAGARAARKAARQSAGAN